MSNVDEVCQQLIAGLREQVPGSFALAGIEVHLGELVELDATALAEALSVELPGVEVMITRVAGALRCLDCGAEYPSDEHPCPVCGSGHAELIHGSELCIARAWGAPAA